MPHLVLAPIDGTPATETAVTLAVALAARMDANVHLLRVLSVSTGTLAARSGLLGVSAEANAMRDAMEEYLAGIGGQHAARLPGDLAWSVEDGHDVADEIVRQATRLDASLIVMATRALGAVGRVLFGSVADKVVRASPIPVILVPPGASARVLRDEPVRRVLLPIDGSTVGASAVDEVERLWPADGTHCTLVHVGDPGTERADVERQAEAARRIAEAVERLRARGFAAEQASISAEEPAHGILEAARAHDADLIAMCTRGSGGIRRLIAGSVATEVVRFSELPVLLVSSAARR